MDGLPYLEDDTHVCLKCRTTITGLDNYVKHRKAGCEPKNTNTHHISENVKTGDTPASKSTDASPTHVDNDPSLKADDFFSSLELQSSAKKTTATSPGSSSKNPSGMLTRSRASAAIHANTTSREGVKGEGDLLSNFTSEHFTPQTVIDSTPATCLMKSESRENILLKVDAAGMGERSDQEDSACEEESNEEYEEEDEEDEDDEGPPRSHTGGKWKPGGLMTRGSPPSWTRTSSSSTHAEDYRGSSTAEWSLLMDDCAGNAGVTNDPPPHFTGGKWKPTLPNQAVMSTQQVCRATHSDEEDDLLQDSDPNNTRIADNSIPRVPPPGHTSGKWVPGKHVRLGESSEGSMASVSGGVDSMLLMPPLRKSGSTVQYWCGSCNRRLSSRTLYERHLLSELHFKRTLQERELDEDPLAEPSDRGSDKRTVRRTEVYLNSELWSRTKKRALDASPDAECTKKQKRRATRREETRCEVCRSKVWRHLMGKHLVSHYHCRKARSGHPQAASLVLDNIHSVVRQAPFQCSPCKFYCNTVASFKQHWISKEHRCTDLEVSGRYWCSFCKYECERSEEMECHLEGVMHQELVSVINRSVPIVIRKRAVLRCGVCGQEFRYNVQLRRHAAQLGHHEDNSASDKYQERFSCYQCPFVGNSGVSLQRHLLYAHKEGGAVQGAYFCSACSLNFNTAEEAALHRRSQEHKYTALASRRDRGLTDEDLSRTCPHCAGTFENVLQLKTHLRDQHAEFLYRCARCGMAFTLPQEVSRHVRESSCAFQPEDNKLESNISKKETSDNHEVAGTSVDVDAKQDDGDKFQTCSQCPFRTDSRAELLFHEVLHGEPLSDPSIADVEDDLQTGLGGTNNQSQVLRYQCPLCTRVFRKATLRCHLRIHTEERPFVCNICFRGFGHRSSMIKHVKRAHRGDAGYVCEMCSFRTASKASMDRHRLTHTQRIKSFLCAVCGASFFLKNTLQQHMKVHTGKDFKCQHQGCIFACRSQAELRNHQQVHSYHRPYHCDTCTYSAKTKAQLLRHQTVHVIDKPHKCPHCPFAARMASHLRRHLRLHTGAKPYRCPYCSYTCNILENLRKHVLSTSKHPGKHLYECRFCCDPEEKFKTNLARDFRAHLVTTHPDHFGTALLAASYVAGIYDADDDPKFIDKPIQLQPRWKRGKSTTVRAVHNRTEKDEEGQEADHPNNSPHLSIAVETSVSEADRPISVIPKENENQESTTTLIKTDIQQVREDAQELLSMVVVTEPTDDVIYIQLPPDSESETMERYCESVLFPSEGDTFLSAEDFNKRRLSSGDRSTSSCEATIMLPLGVDEVEDLEGAKDGERMVLIREGSPERQPQRATGLEEEMTVITIPSSGTSDYLQHDLAHREPEPTDTYEKVVTQTIEPPTEVTAAEEMAASQQQRYLVIFK